MFNPNYSHWIENLPQEQCGWLKSHGFPQNTRAWYIRRLDEGEESDLFWWDGPYLEDIPHERVVACPGWPELANWLGTPDIHLRRLAGGEELWVEGKVWAAHLEGGPQATGGSRIEAAYNLVVAVIEGSGSKTKARESGP